MRKATAVLISALLAASLAGCDTRPSSDTWHLTSHGVLLLKAGQTEPVRISLPEWIWVGEPYGCGPALAVGPAGEAIVTSDVVPVLWRVDASTLQVSLHPLRLDHDTDRDVGFSTIAYSREQGAFIAMSGIQGSLWKIDARLDSAERIGRPDGRSARVADPRARARPCTTRFVDSF